MTAIEIMEQVKAVDQVEAGKAMYYTPHEDRVIVGNDGCQPSNTICLRVGPDDISNIDLDAIESNVIEMLAQWAPPTRKSPDALTAALEQGGWSEPQAANVPEADIREYFSEANFRAMFPGDDATTCGGYTLDACADAVIRWQREAHNG